MSAVQEKAAESSWVGYLMPPKAISLFPGTDAQKLELENLRASVAKYEKENNDLKEHIVLIEEKMQNFAIALSKPNSEPKLSSHSDIQTLKGQIDTLEQALKQSNMTFTENMKNYEKVQVELILIKEENEKQQKKVQELQEKISLEKDRNNQLISQLKQENENASIEIESPAKQLSSKNELSDLVVSESAILLKDRIQTLESENASLKLQVENVKSEFNALIDQKDQMIEKLSIDNQEHSKTISNLKFDLRRSSRILSTAKIGQESIGNNSALVSLISNSVQENDATQLLAQKENEILQYDIKYQDLQNSTKIAIKDLKQSVQDLEKKLKIASEKVKLLQLILLE